MKKTTEQKIIEAIEKCLGPMSVCGIKSISYVDFPVNDFGWSFELVNGRTGTYIENRNDIIMDETSEPALETLDSLKDERLKKLLIDFRDNAIGDSFSSGKNDDIINGFQRARDKAEHKLITYLKQR